MSDDSYPNLGLALRVGRPPWLLFLFLSAVLFLSFHDLSNAKRGIDNYNISQDQMVAGVVEGSLVHRIALLSLGIVATFSLIRYRASRCLHIDGLLGWVLISFVIWTFSSLIWTEDLPLTSKRLVPFGILFLAALAVVRRLSLRDIILWIFFTTAVFLFIGILAEVYFGTLHPFASGYRFAGTLHPNGQGVDCGLLLLSSVAAAKTSRRWRVLLWTCAFIAFIFLILSGSRTSLAATLLALVVYLATLSTKAAKIASALTLGVIVSFLLLLFGPRLRPDLKSTLLLGRDDADRTESLNGRTMIWEDVGYYIRQHPILGYGYNGFWTPTHISEISDEEGQGIASSHSTYLEYFLTLGIVGLAAYTFSLSSGIWYAFYFYRLSQNSAFVFLAALLVFCALVGLLDSTASDESILMFLWMIVLARLAFIDRSNNFANFSARFRMHHLSDTAQETTL